MERYEGKKREPAPAFFVSEGIGQMGAELIQYR